MLARANPGIALTSGAVAHGHAHDGGDQTEARKQIDKGSFDDAAIPLRPLAEREGDWHSVYPLLRDGAPDPVMAQKAEAGEKTAEEYRACYDTGYVTDADRIVIAGNE